MNIISNLKEKISKSRKNNAIKSSKLIFQVTEYNGDLWFVYCGNLVCPCNLFKDDYSNVLRKMRDSFIKRQLI